MRHSKHQSLGNFLQEKRVERNLSQGDLAKRLGYSTNQFVSNWERGLCSPPVDTIERLVQILLLRKSDLVEVMVEDSRRAIEKKIFNRKKVKVS